MFGLSDSTGEVNSASYVVRSDAESEKTEDRPLQNEGFNNAKWPKKKGGQS